jgi:hypothetical protein
MQVYSFDPLRDPRWDDFVERHPHASVFHTTGWLSALERTYGFRPIAFTTSAPPDDLTNALVFARIRSWLTGQRLVSLPFSDHCEPLVDGADELRVLGSSVVRYCGHERLSYVELRPATPASVVPDGFGTAQTFYAHRLDLRPDLDALLRAFHKDSIQRKIRRAEREGLRCEEGRSDALLQKFVHLLELTRRRHQVPRQPMIWFRNLIESLGDRACIHVASKDGQPAAAILTLAFRDTVVYKYGGSDTRLNALGGMPLLLWKTIEQAKQRGARQFDLGRSDCDNLGLVTFKDRLAATRSTLTYWRAPAPKRASADGWKLRLAKGVFSRLPTMLRRAVGDVVYRHIG